MGNAYSTLTPKSLGDVFNTKTGRVDLFSALLYLRSQRQALLDELDSDLDEAYVQYLKELHEEQGQPSSKKRKQRDNPPKL